MSHYRRRSTARTIGTPYGQKRTRTTSTPLGGYSTAFAKFQPQSRRTATRTARSTRRPTILSERQQTPSKPPRSPKRKRTTYRVYVPPTTMGSGRKVPGRYRTSTTPMYRSGTAKRFSVAQGRRKQRTRSGGRSSVRFA